MAGPGKSWLRERIEAGMVRGLTRAYSTVRVNPDKFLLQLRAAYRMPISGYHGVYSLEIGEIDTVADSVIRSGMKVAAVEGAGFGLGGLITIVPDLGILSAITMRTIEKLSLVYGFQYKTDDEIAELWVAAASAEVVEKWRGRLIPLASSAIGAGLNYWFVRAWGQRAKSHFRQRHLLLRQRAQQEAWAAQSQASLPTTT